MARPRSGPVLAREAGLRFVGAEESVRNQSSGSVPGDAPPSLPGRDLESIHSIMTFHRAKVQKIEKLGKSRPREAALEDTGGSFPDGRCEGVTGKPRFEI